MPIQCTTVPQNLPNYSFYINLGFTGLSADNKVLLYGQKGVGGTAPLDVPTLVTSTNVAAGLFGENSMLYRQYEVARTVDPNRSFYAVPVDVVGVEGEYTLTFDILNVSTVIDVSTVVVVYVNGDRYSYVAEVGDTGDDIAAGLEALITADTSAFATAAVAANVLTLTSKDVGEVAGKLVLNSYYERGGVAEADQYSVTIVEATPPSGVPDLTVALQNLAEENYTWEINPYSDGANRALYSDYTCNKWAANKSAPVYGFSYWESPDIASYVTSLQANYNDSHLTLFTNYGMLDVGYLVNVYKAMEMVSLYVTEPSRNTDGTVVGGLLTPDYAATREMSISNRDLITTEGGVAWGVNNNSQTYLEVVNTTRIQTDSEVPDRTLTPLDNLIKLGRIRETVQQAVRVEFEGSQIRKATNFRTLGDRGESNVVTLTEIDLFIKGLGSILAEDRLIDSPQSWIDGVSITFDEADQCVVISVTAELLKKLDCINVIAEVS